ncbi:MAG: hypothetical protein IJ514_02485 [Clostridia bacterium]|nr:hypothetical protein [Clostridia bacterium]
MGVINLEQIEIDYRIFKRNHTLKEFEREAYLSLFTNENIPSVICEGVFKEAQEAYSQYLFVVAEHHLRYTAEIGYNRTEQYWGETLSGKRELKERTVTDWRSISGETEESALSSCELSNALKEYVDDFQEETGVEDFENTVEETGWKAAVSPYAEGMVSVEPVHPKSWHVEAATARGAGFIATHCEFNLPGDISDNFQYVAESKVNACVNVIVSNYILPFELNGKKYGVTAYALNNKMRLQYCPTENVEQAQKDRDKTKRRTSLFLPLLFFMIWFFADISFLPIVWMALYAIGHRLYWEQKTITKSTKTKEEWQIEKREKLKVLFEEKGFSPLNETELKRFDAWKQTNN